MVGEQLVEFILIVFFIPFGLFLEQTFEVQRFATHRTRPPGIAFGVPLLDARVAKRMTTQQFAAGKHLIVADWTLC